MSSIQDTTAAAYRPTAPSRSRTGRSWLKYALPLLAIGALAAVGWRNGWLSSLGAEPADNGATFQVKPMDLEITLIEDGEVKPREQIEIKSEVEGEATVLELIAESTRVSKGDVLVVLASDGIVDRLEQENIEMSNMQSEYEAAKQALSIQLNQNASDIRRDELDLALKERDLEKYLNGEFLKTLQGVDIKIEENNLKLQRKREEAERNAKLLERGFVTQSKIDQLDLEIRTLEMQDRQNELEKRILLEYEKPMQEQKQQEQIDQARDALQRTREKAASQEAQARAKVTQYEALIEVRNKRLERLRAQLDKCRILAPRDGVVQYPQNGNWRWSDPITVGSQVRESQTLCVIPDTSQMLVSTRIHEADRHRVKEGLPCVIKVPAVPGQVFHGSLAKVAKFADSANSWLNPELKEHATEILLDATDAPLSPGDSAEVEILIDRLSNVLAVPVQSVQSRGQRHFVFVQHSLTADPVEITLGDSNVRFVEVRSGLDAGDRVIMAADDQMLSKLPRVSAEGAEGGDENAEEQQHPTPRAGHGGGRPSGGRGGKRPG